MSEHMPAWADDAFIVTGAVWWSCVGLIGSAVAAGYVHKGVRAVRARVGARRLVKGAEALTREAAVR